MAGKRQRDNSQSHPEELRVKSRLEMARAICERSKNIVCVWGVWVYVCVRVRWGDFAII